MSENLPHIVLMQLTNWTLGPFCKTQRGGDTNHRTNRQGDIKCLRANSIMYSRNWIQRTFLRDRRPCVLLFSYFSALFLPLCLACSNSFTTEVSHHWLCLQVCLPFCSRFEIGRRPVSGHGDSDLCLVYLFTAVLGFTAVLKEDTRHHD